ncbi:MAG: hypothetical protein ACKVZ0_07770 [Gemmatimonadales bacterium]
MVESAILYAGMLLVAGGMFRWMARAWRRTITRRAVPLLVPGAVLVALGVGLPAPDHRVTSPLSHLDSIAPVWQFAEFHEKTIAAPPTQVYRAAELVRADEIRLFRLLTAIRRGGRPLPGTILDAGTREPLIEVAIRGGFVDLVRAPPVELVFGSAVLTRKGQPRPATPAEYRAPQRAGTALATMNFVVTPTRGGSRLTTETRIYANDAWARQRFAVYWRLIYPGSALIRRMWLAAIARRALSQPGD